MTHEEIYAKVKDVLVDALGVDDDEITPTAVIRDDLGAESIDFLDIMFRLEKAFNIKIPKGELMPENVANDPNFVNNGVVTPAGITMLREKMPHSNFTEFEKDPKVEAMSKLFTVEAIVKYVEGKLK
ncbi:MAG: acyl carrier protein [Burkholderiales bacterium]|nr:acyl carrier protein [Phycisphaerae bacterium]